MSASEVEVPKVAAKQGKADTAVGADSLAMAKKKSPGPEAPQTGGSESEKESNLRALNRLLLKQTTELRDQVNSLMSSKQALESDLAHFTSLVNSLRTHSSLFQDQAIESDVEQNVSSICVSDALEKMVRGAEKAVEDANQKLISSDAEKERTMTRFRVLEGEMEKIAGDKKEVEVQLEALRREKERLVAEFGRVVEECGIGFQSEVTDDLQSVLNCFKHLLAKFNDLNKEKSDIQHQKAQIVLEVAKLREVETRLSYEIQCGTDALASAHQEKDNLYVHVEELKGKLSKLIEETDKNEGIRAQQEVKIGDLKENIRELSAIISNLKGRLVENESGYEEALSRLQGERDSLTGELNLLKQQKSGMVLAISKLEEDSAKDKEAFALLMEEKEETEKNLQLISDAKELAEGRLDASLHESEILSRKIVEIVGEKEEMGKIIIEKDALLAEWQEKCDHQTETSKRFEGELIDLKSLYELILIEKEDVENALAVQKEKADEASEKFQRKLEDSEQSLERVLSMLKNSAEVLVGSNEAKMEMGEDDQILLPFTAQLEAITKAFKERDMEGDALKKELQSLRISSQAQKRICVWSWISSATILAAGSMAFLSRGR